LLVPINVEFQSLMQSLLSFLGAALVQDETKLSSAEIDRYAPFREWMWVNDDGLMRSGQKSGHASSCHFELPEHFQIAVTADPQSSLAIDYRNWVRNEWMPGVRRIAEVITSSCHLMEVVPKSRLEELFGKYGPHGNSWHCAPRGLFFSMWLAYARGWESTLMRWDEGDLSHIRPKVPFPVGIFWIIVEGQTVVGDIQKRLTGQSQMHGSRGLNVLHG